MELLAVVDWLMPAGHRYFHIRADMTLPCRILEVSKNICRLLDLIFEFYYKGFIHKDIRN